MAIEFGGFLYDDAGDAVENATLNLYDRGTVTPVRATTTTDSTGWWTISHGTQGRFDVEVVNGTSKRRRKYDTREQIEYIEVANFRIRNPADTFEYDIVPAAITAARQLNLPLITGTDTLASLGLAQTWTGVQTLNSPVLTTPDINGGTADSLTALSVRSTGAAYDLTLATATVFTAGRTLTVNPGDAARTLTLSGNPTLDDWFDQAVKAASSPTFANLTITSFAANWTNAGRTVADLGVVTTVDINGGTVDGAIVGGAAAAAGTFTDLTVTGDLTVQGNTVTVNVATMSVEDPLIYLANGNSASDTLDIGFYGLYDTTGAQDLHTGIFRDATDGKIKAFVGLQTAPTTTVNTAGTGYTAATVVVGSLETATVVTTGGIELGHATDTTISRTGAGAIAVEGVAVLLSGGALGTPSSGTGTNITGIPAANILAGSFGAGAYVISTSLQAATIELGHATDTTLSRVSAGVVAVEGVQLATGTGTASGTNTGDQTITLTGDVTGTGTGSFAATVAATHSGSAHHAQQSLFETIAVAGQSNVVADSATDTLTLVAGANVTITTDATTDTVTIAATDTSGANTALSNLAAVAINTALLDDAAAADDFGSATLPWKDIFIAGSSGTPGTNNFRITGASTSGTRVITLPDATGTLLYAGGALGTPASGVMTNVTGVPAAAILAGSFGAGAYVISTSLQAATIELGHATDTTISRTGAGAIAVEGVGVLLSGGALGTPSSGTLTNCTIPASALSGTTLAAGVTGSSLTSVGTLASPVLTTPDINGGTADGLTSFGVRSTGTGAFDLKIANAENLTVGAKTLTVQLGDADRTLILGASPSLSGTNTGDNAANSSSTYIGTTAVALNRASAALTLAGITLTTPDIGTPSAGVLTNATGLPVAGIAASTSTALGVGSIELGHATDTTISRSAAGVIAVESVVVPSISSTNTLTNKRVTKRAPAVTQSATPTINTDNTDVAHITGLAQAITSMTTNLSGTPVEGDTLRIDITDDGTARAITWGASFEASTVALPTTTVLSTRLDVGFLWNVVTSKWRCVASA